MAVSSGNSAAICGMAFRHTYWICIAGQCMAFHRNGTGRDDTSAQGGNRQDCDKVLHDVLKKLLLALGNCKSVAICKEHSYA